MCLAKLVKAWHQPPIGEGWDDRQLEYATYALVCHHRTGMELELAQVGTDIAAVFDAGTGECHLLPDTVEQLHAKEIFERADLTADGALGHTHLVCGSRETLVPSGGFKQSERHSAGDLAFHAGHTAKQRVDDETSSFADDISIVLVALCTLTLEVAQSLPLR